MIDLSNIPLIDNHCHMFAAGREPRPFEKGFSISLLDVRPEDMRTTLYFQQMMAAMRRFYGLPGTAGMDEVLARRDELAFGDRPAYFAALFKDAGLQGVLCDYGFPIRRKHHPELAYTREELEEYHTCVKTLKVWSIDRIEWIANRLLKEELPFDVFHGRLIEEAEKMVRSQGLVAIKSVIAYYTGLDVRPLSYRQFRDGYYAYLSDPSSWEREKTVRDYTFITACEICRKLDIPLQVHTGLGDTPDCHIVRVNPALLTDALNDERVKGTKLVLIHGGYPYCEELGMLVNHYQDVYCDLSSFVPFASIGAKEKMRNILELAPLSKVMYGTDGGIIPESLWIGALTFRRAFTAILNELISEGDITEAFALEAAQDVMHRNCERLYKL